jgi:hypothetical protein
MLELWRPPQGAGDPVGCLATTYTFAPGLFDEQCLARYLEIESEPNREDLAFLLERESRLGSVYAGVLVDYTQAGVAHSLRWDVLPVRIRGGKQHAKLSLLAWTRHLRIIVASANLTEPGYRTNYEVAAAVDISPTDSNAGVIAEAISFLRSLVARVPGASAGPPEVRRAQEFLSQVESATRAWTLGKREGTLRQKLVCTSPSGQDEQAARSSLDEAVQDCRRRGGSPTEVWIASPFFDMDDDSSRVASALCKLMARGKSRKIRLCLPAVRDGSTSAVPRLAAPLSLLRTPRTYQATVTVETLPEFDVDKNRRQWHAKMLALQGDDYSAVMVGSSNFTCAGMGVLAYRNTEANLLTIAERKAYGRDAGNLEALWPAMGPVADPDSAEWLGARPDEEEEQAGPPPLPAGFLSASYRAGDERWVVLRLDPLHLPEDWKVLSCGKDLRSLLSVADWRELGQPVLVEVQWLEVQPPEKLLVRWPEGEAFLGLNVEDSRHLPPPAQLDQMSADEMLWILAATDPSAAFRAWAKRQQPSDLFDSDLDSATPVDLDPLRRYDLQSTFLHRIRRRARVLAQLRANLQRPVWGRQALEWRLRGLVGIEALAGRLVRELSAKYGATDEALLTLADFLIVLREADYQPLVGSLPKTEFDEIYRPFLTDLSARLGQQVGAHRDRVSADVMEFWDRVGERCRA